MADQKIKPGIYQLYGIFYEVTPRGALKYYLTGENIRSRQGKEGILYQIADKYDFDYDLDVYILDEKKYYRIQDNRGNTFVFELRRREPRRLYVIESRNIIERMNRVDEEEREVSERILNKWGKIGFYVNGEFKEYITNPYSSGSEGEENLRKGEFYFTLKKYFKENINVSCEIFIEQDFEGYYKEKISESTQINAFPSYSKWWNNQVFWTIYYISDICYFDSYITDCIDGTFIKEINNDYLMKANNTEIIKNCYYVINIIYSDTYIEPIEDNQKFADGKNHCLFTPIKKWCEEMANSANSRKSKYRYNGLLKKCCKYIDIFKKGIDKENLQNVSDDMGLGFTIRDFIKYKYINISPKNKKKLRTFEYINTQINHVEELLCNDDMILIKNINEMKSILKNLIINDSYVYIKGTYQNPRLIYTNDKIYKYDDENNNIIFDFNNEKGLNKFKLYKDDDPELFKFILEGVNYSNHILFNNQSNNNELHEYDLKQAYTKYKDYNGYIGFPNVMTPVLKLENWNVELCKKYIGYYEVSVKINKYNKYYDKLGIFNGYTYILSSVEILLFSKYGCEFIFIAGSYSYKPFDFDIKDSLLMENKRYAKWAGMLHMINEFDTTRLYTNDLMAGIVANRYKVVKNNNFNKIIDNGNFKIDNEKINKNEYIISLKKKNVGTLSHIGGFITAYTRCHILEKVFNIPIENIYGIKLDSIVCYGKYNIFNEYWHIDKHLEKGKNISINFSWGNHMFNSIGKLWEYSNFYYEQYLILTGCGGSGKTHTILSNRPNTFYISRMWRLICEKMKEYKTKGLTINQLIGDECKKYFEDKPYPSCILLDELNMYEKNNIEEVIKQFPYSQVILAGDVEIINNQIIYFQCDLMNITQFNNFEKFKIVKFYKNYRCKDNILLDKINTFRNKMIEYNFNLYNLLKIFKDLFKDYFVDINFVCQSYNYKFDWVLCSTKNEKYDGHIPVSKYLTSLLNGNKYRCLFHNTGDVMKRLNGENVNLRGEIIIDPAESLICKKYEKTDAFTIHSVQGITIKNPNKLFIDINNIFDVRQLYTAVSRVEYGNQLFIFESDY